MTIDPQRIKLLLVQLATQIERVAAWTEAPVAIGDMQPARITDLRVWHGEGTPGEAVPEDPAFTITTYRVDGHAGAIGVALVWVGDRARGEMRHRTLVHLPAELVRAAVVRMLALGLTPSGIRQITDLEVFDDERVH